MGAVMANALRKTVCSIAVPFLLLAGAANAQIPQTFQTIINELGEFSDLGHTVFNARVDDRYFHFLCTPTPKLVRAGNDFTVDVVVQNGLADWYQSCQGVVAFDLGPLPAGRYTFTTNYSGAITTSKKLTIDVEASARSCTSDPRSGDLYVEHATRSAATMAEDLKDPVKRAALGNPLKVAVNPVDGGVNPLSRYPRSVLTYATPQNLLPVAQMLKSKQAFQRAARPLLNIPMVYCAGFYVGSTRGTLIEYFNASLNHYFYTTSPEEAAWIRWRRRRGRVGAHGRVAAGRHHARLRYAARDCRLRSAAASHVPLLRHAGQRPQLALLHGEPPGVFCRDAGCGLAVRDVAVLGRAAARRRDVCGGYDSALSPLQ
jgi:hypothetical protein